MKYIKLFKNDAEYQAFRGGDYITPNLCLNSETWETKCEPEEVSIFPEGFFPLYLTTDYCKDEAYGKFCYVNPTETTIKLYEILKTICEEYGTKNPYDYYINDINLDIYLDDIKICNSYISHINSRTHPIGYHRPQSNRLR